MSDVRPVRLQLSRRRGFDLQALSRATNGLPAVKVSRPGKWGNPFYVGGYHKIGAKGRGLLGFARLTALDAKYADDSYTFVTTNEESVAMLRRYCQEWGAPTNISELRGKNLACFCGPRDCCHADFWLELANTPICEAV